MISERSEFFAASNTEIGFVSYFKQNFRDRSERCYIIKGGPGTGKSRLLNELGASAENAGAEVEYYYCSSDPTSLDGIFVKLGNVTLSVIDGTSPHSEEMIVAGAVDNIIDLGRFWDPVTLMERRDEIIHLNAKKRIAYKSAYRALAAYGALSRYADVLVEECTDIQAIQEDACKIARSLSRGKSLPSPLEAVGTRGRTALDGFEKNAQLCISISDNRNYGISYLYFDSLLGELGYACRYSPHPILKGRCNAILAGDVAITDHTRMPCDDTVIDVCEFVDRSAFLLCKERVSRLRLLADGSLSAALDAFADAGDAHMKLEIIYSSAMDFAAKEEYSASLCAKISHGVL